MNDEKLVNSIKQHLDESTEHSSDELSHSLAQLRQSALDKAEPRSSFLHRLSMPVWNYKALSAFAGVTAVALVLLLLNQPQIQQSDINGLAELELLMSEDNLEFYEDLEFYQWLLLEDQQSG